MASKDGYLLHYFCKAEIPVLGLEPAESVAKVAKKACVPVARVPADEIAEQRACISEWDGRFVLPIPRVQVPS